MTTILEQARDKLIRLCREEDVDVTQPVIVSPLSPDEAIGSEADDSFVIRKGKETVVEATFSGARGQAKQEIALGTHTWCCFCVE